MNTSTRLVLVHSYFKVTNETAQGLTKDVKNQECGDGYDEKYSDVDKFADTYILLAQWCEL